MVPLEFSVQDFYWQVVAQRLARSHYGPLAQSLQRGPMAQSLI